MIWATLTIGTGDRAVSNNVIHNTTVTIDCDASIEAVICELTEKMNGWAVSWARYPGTVTITRRETQ